MERLTTREQGLVIKCVGCIEKGLCYPNTGCLGIDNALKKLKEYEDTGLTPEQILAMDEEYRKMAKELGEHKKKLGNIERYLDGCKL